MTTLTNHLQQHGPSMFDGADYNEIVLLLYLFLSDAIRDAATEFTLSPVKCSWANTTSSLGSFRRRRDQGTSFLQAIDLMQERDLILRQLLHLKSASGNYRVYLINNTLEGD